MRAKHLGCVVYAKCLKHWLRRYLANIVVWWKELDFVLKQTLFETLIHICVGSTALEVIESL